jgi:K+ potassium transporter
VYVRAVNYCLLILCVIVVCLFRTSTTIGDAYGIAVTALMLLTTMLMILFMISVWRSPLLLVVLFGAVFILLEGALWTSTLLKTPNGGWLAIAMSAGWMAFMAVWLAGCGAHRRGLVATPLDVLVVVDGSGAGTKVPIRKRVDDSGTTTTTVTTTRAPGVALFYTDEIDTADTAPPVLAHLLARLPACLFQVNICLHVRVVPLPEVAVHERLLARDTDVDGFYSVVARYGYLERPIHDAAFAAAVLDHVIARLHDRIAVASATDPALATALDLPASFAADYSAWAAAVAAAAEGDSLVCGSGGGGNGVGGASVKGGVGASAQAATSSSSPITAIKRALATAPASPILPDRCSSARSAIAQIRVLETARDQQTSLFVLGRSDVELPAAGGVSERVRNVVLGMPFAVLCKFFNDDLLASYGVPREQALQVVLPYDF